MLKYNLFIITPYLDVLPYTPYIGGIQFPSESSPTAERINIPHRINILKRLSPGDMRLLVL